MTYMQRRAILPFIPLIILSRKPNVEKPVDKVSFRSTREKYCFEIPMTFQQLRALVYGNFNTLSPKIPIQCCVCIELVGNFERVLRRWFLAPCRIRRCLQCHGASHRVPQYMRNDTHRVVFLGPHNNWEMRGRLHSIKQTHDGIVVYF